MAASKSDSSKDLVVLAPMVAVHDDSGRFHHFYRGAVLPFGSKDEVDRLKEMGMVGEADENVIPGTAVLPTA